MKCRVCLKGKERQEAGALLTPCTGCHGAIHIRCFREVYAKSHQWWEIKCKHCLRGYEGPVVIRVVESVFKQKLDAHGSDILPYIKDDAKWVASIKNNNLDNRMLAIFRTRLAGMYFRCGNNRKRTLLLSEALEAMIPVLGEDHIKVAEVKEELAKARKQRVAFHIRDSLDCLFFVFIFHVRLYLLLNSNLSLYLYQ